MGSPWVQFIATMLTDLKTSLNVIAQDTLHDGTPATAWRVRTGAETRLSVIAQDTLHDGTLATA